MSFEDNRLATYVSSMDICKMILADASQRLSNGMKRRKDQQIAGALQEIVESAMPRPTTPHQRVRHVHPAAKGNPHRVWRWVTRTGMMHLVAEALNYEAVAITVYVTRPGVSGRRETIYRDMTRDPGTIETLVKAAARQIQRLFG